MPFFKFTIEGPANGIYKIIPVKMEEISEIYDCIKCTLPKDITFFHAVLMNPERDGNGYIGFSREKVFIWKEFIAPYLFYDKSEAVHYFLMDDKLNVKLNREKGYLGYS